LRIAFKRIDDREHNVIADGLHYRAKQQAFAVTCVKFQDALNADLENRALGDRHTEIADDLNITIHTT